MSAADEAIKQAQAQRDASDKQDDLTLAVAEAAQSGVPLLWDDIRDYMEAEVVKLRRDMTAAEYLRSDRFHPDNLTIQTTVLPIVKLELSRHGLYITTNYTETLNGMTHPTERSLGRFRFTASRQLQACLTDEVGALHPQQVGDRLLKPVCDFLLKHPPMNIF